MDKNCALHTNDDWPAGIFFIKVGDGDGMCATTIFCSRSDQIRLLRAGRAAVELRIKVQPAKFRPKPMEIA